jgi:hypothetical protein
MTDQNRDPQPTAAEPASPTPGSTPADNTASASADSAVGDAPRVSPPDVIELPAPADAPPANAPAEDSAIVPPSKPESESIAESPAAAPAPQTSIEPAKPAAIVVKPDAPDLKPAAEPVGTAPLAEKAAAEPVGTAPLAEKAAAEPVGTAPLDEKAAAEPVGTAPLDEQTAGTASDTASLEDKPAPERSPSVPHIEEPTMRASGTMRVVTVTESSGKTDNLPPESQPGEVQGSGEISLLEAPAAGGASTVEPAESDTSLLRKKQQAEAAPSPASPSGAVLTGHRPAAGDDSSSTGVLPARQSARRSAQTERDLPLDLVQISAQRELVLLVRGMVERLMLEENTPVTLGRTDMKSRTIPDVDLTPYGALDRGVSREHATLQINGSRILVTDLGSTNGTFVAGLRLPPNTPTQLQKGDELMLGRLAIQVLFR